jgi:hypothetical protein
VELEQGLAQVQVGLALVVQGVEPVAAIPHGISRRQEDQLLERRRRDLAGNQHRQHQQGASSSDAHGPFAVGNRISAAHRRVVELSHERVAVGLRETFDGRSLSLVGQRTSGASGTRPQNIGLR